MKTATVFSILTLFLGGMLGVSMQNEVLPIPFSSKETDPVANALPVFMRQSPQWALEKLEAMTLEEKIAQSFMVEVTPNKGEEHLAVIDSLVENYKIGGIIMFQGTIDNTKKSIQRLQEKSITPLLVGIDGEWGSNMRLSDGARFPFQLTMGAANDLNSTRNIARSIGQEMNELGIHINFSPVVDMNTNPNNPVIGFRSFGENPLTVSKNSLEMIRGMQEYHVLTSMKHFPGHGDTEIDSHLDLPVVNKSKKELSRIDWLPYKQGRLIGASSVMVGHLSVPALDPSGLPASISPTIIKDVLRKELKFEGLVISDALNMKALTKRYGAIEIVKRAYIAGNDILLYPSKVKESIEMIRLAVENDEISEEEVNEKALRILRAKFYSQNAEGKQPTKLSNEQIEFAKMQVYEKALTVIKNEDAIPVRDASDKNLILNLGASGEAFNEMASFYMNAEIQQYTSAKDAQAILRFKLKDYDRIFINLIAPSVLSKNDFSYPDGWREFLKDLPDGPKVYVSFFGNPYAVKDRFDFEKVAAVVLGYQNSETGQNRVAQLLFGGIQGTSKLPITLSVDYQEGFGIDTKPASRLKFTVPMEFGLSDTLFNRIDSIVQEGLNAEAFPSAQVVVAKDGKVIYRKAFGYQTYEKTIPVNNHTLYDLASITKIASSTASLMYLEDKHQFSLDSTLGYYLEDLTKDTPYFNIKLKDMMAHQAGLTPWIPFYTKTLENKKPSPHFYSKTPEGNKTAIVAKGLYLDKSYEDSMMQRILNTPLRRSKTYKYSDIGYYFVKRIIEKETNTPLDTFTLTNFYGPMGLPSMGYHPLSRFDISNIAPTEEDRYFRYQKVQGYVHDMGAAMQHGVGGHAGLFSNATDMAGFMQMLLNKGEYGGERYLSKSVIDEFTACQFCPKNRRGAGFDKPVVSGTGGPTTEAVSKSSFGHTGFTGTMAWADPSNNINYVFLSNRTYPDAENWKIVKMNTRTEIQKVIYEAFNKVEPANRAEN